MEKKKMHELVVYNTHDLDQFTVFHCDGCTISVDKYEIVIASCGLGPYLAFFIETEDKNFYRLRGPYHGLEPFYIIDSTHIAFTDETMKAIRKALIEKIETIRARGK